MSGLVIRNMSNGTGITGLSVNRLLDRARLEEGA